MMFGGSKWRGNLNGEDTSMGGGFGGGMGAMPNASSGGLGATPAWVGAVERRPEWAGGGPSSYDQYVQNYKQTTYREPGTIGMDPRSMVGPMKTQDQWQQGQQMEQQRAARQKVFDSWGATPEGTKWRKDHMMESPIYATGESPWEKWNQTQGTPQVSYGEDTPMYAGGSKNFDESTGQYRHAPPNKKMPGLGDMWGGGQPQPDPNRSYIGGTPGFYSNPGFGLGLAPRQPPQFTGLPASMQNARKPGKFGRIVEEGGYQPDPNRSYIGGTPGFYSNPGFGQYDIRAPELRGWGQGQNGYNDFNNQPKMYQTQGGAWDDMQRLPGQGWRGYYGGPQRQFMQPRQNPWGFRNQRTLSNMWGMY